MSGLETVEVVEDVPGALQVGERHGQGQVYHVHHSRVALNTSRIISWRREKDREREREGERDRKREGERVSENLSIKLPNIR